MRQLIDHRRLGAFLLGLRRLCGAPGGGFLVGTGRFLQRAHRLAPDLIGIHAELAQNIDRDAIALADQAQQQMLGADVVLAQAARFVHRQFDHALGARCQIDLAERRAAARPGNALHQFGDALVLHVEIAQHFPGNAAFFAQQAQQ